jgi:hypothetical protein
MRSEITLNEMRERIARLIFGADWIGDLTDEQYELLRNYPLNPRDIQRSDGSTVRLNHVEKYPLQLASKIDHARGRQARMEAQIISVDTWIQDRGLPIDPYLGADRKNFNALVRSHIDAQKRAGVSPMRRRGPKPQILPRIIADMESDFAAGRLTPLALEGMSDKDLTFRYQARRERVRAARAYVLNRVKK